MGADSPSCCRSETWRQIARAPAESLGPGVKRERCHLVPAAPFYSWSLDPAGAKHVPKNTPSPGQPVSYAGHLHKFIPHSHLPIQFPQRMSVLVASTSSHSKLTSEPIRGYPLCKCLKQRGRGRIPSFRREPARPEVNGVKHASGAGTRSLTDGLSRLYDKDLCPSEKLSFSSPARPPLSRLPVSPLLP